MKDYKFRGISINGREWVYGDLVHAKQFTYIVIASNNPVILLPPSSFIEVDEKTVGIFMGLKDKNGKEVYEGDIYEYKRSEQEKQKDFYKTRKVVIFSNGSFGFEEWNTDDKGKLRDRLSYIPGHITNREFYYIDFDLEVIGNIHQDKELLES